MSDNPLARLYRHKSVYMSLPSKGNFYLSGISLSADNEIGIMPMTATDEIKLKTPDALFNGEALYSLFKSCIPDIIDPREIPICDMDKLLLGIRVATSGPELTINTKCPSCNKGEEYQIDLTVIMNSAQNIPDDNIVSTHDDVSVELTPLTLKSQILNQIETFYQYRMQQLLNDTTLPESDKIEKFSEALAQAIVIKTGQVAQCIKSVTIDEIKVTDADHIFKWVENMDTNTHKKIKRKIESLSDSKIKNTIKVQCPQTECNHVYEVIVDLNPVNFF
jgi:hypothetical protein